MMPKTNKNLLIEMSVMGNVSQPNFPGLPSEPYRLDSNGSPFLLPTWGSITHNISVGDAAFGWEADCIHPGVSIKYEDENGNRYFSNKKDSKRWVIYGGQVEATAVNPEWNNWLRFTSIEKPDEIKSHDWQLEHEPNQSGTSKAYSPKSSIFNNKSNNKKRIDYEKWSPKD